MSETDRTIYIHMGMYKTGTKSVQFFMSEHRDFFRRHGVYYPPGSGIDFYRHKNLFPVKRKKFAQIVAQAEKLGCKTIVLSSDTLCREGVSDQSLEDIKKAAPGYQLKYILYVKRIDDIAKDWYLESRKRNYSNATYKQFIDHQYKNKKSILFPSGLIERCVGQIGGENVIIRNYNAAQNTVTDFCAIIGLTLPQEMIPQKRYNPNPPYKAVPYFTPAIFSKLPYGHTEVQLEKKLRAAFRPQSASQISPDVAKAVDAEVERLDADYLPGYRDAFAQRPLSLQCPDLEADPYRVYVAELLHSLYRRVTWPERLIWRIGSLFYLLLVQIPGLQKLLSRFTPYLGKK